jgi:hypothetical protein
MAHDVVHEGCIGRRGDALGVDIGEFKPAALEVLLSDLVPALGVHQPVLLRGLLCVCDVQLGVRLLELDHKVHLPCHRLVLVLRQPYRVRTPHARTTRRPRGSERRLHLRRGT